MLDALSKQRRMEALAENPALDRPRRSLGNELAGQLDEGQKYPP